LLVPGLWMPAAAMRVMARSLEQAGYTVHAFTYAGRASFDDNLARFTSCLREQLGGRPAHLVGHSLGGVLLLEALRDRDLPVASAVLLGAPVRGCMAGRRLGSIPGGSWMMGGCRERWAEREACWRRAEPLGVIAGTVPLGLGRLLGRLPGDSDGVVRVEETTVEGMADRMLVPLGHSMLIFSRSVCELLDRFMRKGRFQ
jgi:pimeloyl-ACP methyl ester carboxylesterase